MSTVTSPDEELVLTVDVGGSGVKVSAYDLSSHRSVGRLTRAFEPGSWNANGTECDLTSWWNTCVKAIGSLVGGSGRHPRHFAALTAGAIRIPFVLLDGDDQIVRPCIANADRRAHAEAEELEAELGRMELYRLTGHWAAPEFGLPKLLWLRRHEPENLRKARRLLQLHDWVIFKLSGAVASEPSSAAMSQLLAVSGDGWLGDLIDHAGVPEEWLPELCAAGTRVGGLSPDVASAVGLGAGTPVHVGGGDTQLSALGAGALASGGRVVVVAGSTAPVQMAHRGGTAADDASFPLLMSRQLIAGWSACEANASGVGSVLAELGGLARLQGEPLLRELESRSFLVDEARGPDDGHLSVAVGNPFFGPTSWSSPPPRVVAGLRPEHTGDDVMRSARRCACFAVEQTVASVRHSVPGPRAPITVTGGLSTDPTWAQTLADTLGETVGVANADLTAGIGGASVVVGESLWSPDDDRASTTYQPDPALESEHRKATAAYLRLFQDPGTRGRPGEVTCDAGAC